ncbi:putative SGNH hydrolase-type esterase domain-containing protein [Medicago truncatula]|uniref:Putative SGNH hydrolase-type esterase domain-containing protein n=1 Tax=Medicago truncatula TaxID=3880 RepID=A0A396GZC5_MEDTR|nr:putative SGNH hydrolase-type esterase domain-containing protein [Medicago truncatula]
MMRPKFVLFGSSIVQHSYYQGWGATLTHLYARKADIVLRGYAAWTSRHALQVLDKIFPKSLSHKIRIIFLSSPPISEAQLKFNIDEFGQPLRTNEDCRIYLEACLDLCREMKIKVIDMCDGVHLSTEGSEIVTKEILNVIKKAEWEPSLYCKLMPAEFGEDTPYDMVSLDGKTTVNFSNVPFPQDKYT